MKELKQKLVKGVKAHLKLPQKNKQLHSLQKQLSTLKKRQAKLVKDKRRLLVELKDARNAVVADSDTAPANATPSLKEGVKFTDSVVVCAAHLIGECDVAAGSCGKIIQSVARHIFDTEITEEDLPSKRSAIRFCWPCDCKATCQRYVVQKI